MTFVTWVKYCTIARLIVIIFSPSFPFSRSVRIWTESYTNRSDFTTWRKKATMTLKMNYVFWNSSDHLENHVIQFRRTLFIGDTFNKRTSPIRSFKFQTFGSIENFIYSKLWKVYFESTWYYQNNLSTKLYPKAWHQRHETTHRKKKPNIIHDLNEPI